ncbi:MAG: right-handed parallel beta-helix repeat-containing protein [Saprospiraceae bacterium]|nr:right-handed parallel beta-helix repeat-containing protein [Saprospiraceae bacterium]
MGSSASGNAIASNGIQIDGNNCTVSNNTIQYCFGSGVSVVTGDGNLISQNSFLCNTTGGISLSSGGNNSIGSPGIDNTTLSQISGTALPSAIVEVYINNAAACSNAPCQGRTFLGTATANVSGSWVLSAPFSNTVDVGDEITATARDGSGNTSAFSSCATVATAPTCNYTDSLTLVALYNSTGGPNWTNSTNWLVPGQPIGTWFGVTVNGQGCVRNLYLNSNNMTGSIPDELGTLQSLERLRLTANQLNGPIPITLGDLQNALEIRLNVNGLSGSIPQNLETSKISFFWICGQII